MESLNIWVDRSLFSLPICGLDWTSYVFFLNRVAISNGSARIFVPVPTFLQCFSLLETIFCWKLYQINDVEVENQRKKTGNYMQRIRFQWTSYVFFLKRRAISNRSVRIFVPVRTYLQGFSWLLCSVHHSSV